MAALATFVCPNDGENITKLWSIGADVVCAKCGVVWTTQMTSDGPKITGDSGRREPKVNLDADPQ